MSACRPRSYVSPTLLDIGVHIHRNHASRQLVDILTSILFSASYKEVQRYEFSALGHDRVNTGGSKKGYIQYAFDNADFNIRNLTGHGTFHSMGGVRFITPAKNQESMTVNRLLYSPSAYTVATRGKLQVNCYKKPALPGLKGINIRELATVSDATARSVRNAIVTDVLWSSARWLEESSAPFWNGFMRSCIHTGKISCSVTAIEADPFIHLDPSNRSTIYTALLFAVEECKCHNQGSCIVTFDQPLYAKASEIVAAAPPGELDSVTLRLGGFYLLVSLVGSIGFIMSGRGIEELWMQAYGMENSFGVYQEESHKLFLEVSTGEKMIPDAVESPALMSFLGAFERKCTELSEQSLTGKLWVQYLGQVVILRLFIRAESCFSCIPEVVQCLGGASGIKAGSPEQHVELRDSCRTRDARDVAVLLSCLKDHSPWNVDCLRSLASGVIGDGSINSDQAEYVGLGAIKRIIGSNFGEVKLTQKNRVKPLSAVARSILIQDYVLEVNSHQLFMRRYTPCIP
ncbi:hypothetical protein PR048_023990 [Dryococelus australis]|uniref:Uncharacterized protein n=1 Tax=Dryococelus australis TaxID=614101 RepID=A0ABQ9GVQ9_9NEOP|nr:hypothetical protein PR048_023990 [Dryococelus australis]